MNSIDAAEPGATVKVLRTCQIVLGLVWFLGWLNAACISAWLPLNYLLLDLYLFIRERRNYSVWDQTSRPVRIFLEFSPVLMLPTTFFLGMLGTGIYERYVQ